MTEYTKTQMIFRIHLDGTVDALFPYEIATSYYVTCYSHVGQHSGADYVGVIRTTRPATPKQYKDLHKELTGRGYNIEIVKRQNYDRYLRAVKESRRVA